MARSARHALVVVASAIVLGGIACSSFGDEDDPPAPPNDAGSESSSTIDDAGVDTALATDAAPEAKPGECAHTFCDDFDGPSLSAKWTAILVGAPGHLDLVTDGGVPSPPNALLAAFDGLDAAFGGASVRKDFAVPSATSIECRARTLVEKIENGSPTLFRLAVKMNAAAPVTSTDIQLALKSDLTSLSLFQEGVAPVYSPFALALPFQKWLDLRAWVDIVTGDVSVTLDGKALFVSKLTVPPTQNNGVSFQMGVFDIGSGDENRVRFDDVWCDVK